MNNAMKPLTPAPLSAVKINDKFWSRYISLVQETVIPYQWETLNDNIQDAEKSHCIRNFEIASGRCEGEFHGFVFQDSDLYKWLEAVAYSLEIKPDKSLENKADSVIELLEATQMPDGYLNTYFQIKAPDARWSNLSQAHELYCAGHLIEAAVAYYYATRKKRFLNVAIRLADLIDNVFGSEDGKCKGYPGHQEIELALVKLWQATDDRKYLHLAAHFINIRGSQPHYFDIERKQPGHHVIWQIPDDKIDHSYCQAHITPKDQAQAVGHAVRAVYMYSAMADLAALNNDEELLNACRLLYNDIANTQMYITGGIGATRHGEAFTGAYDLPDDTVYAETCASIGLMMFCRRMAALEQDGRYIDTLERALYNTVIAGMSLSGKEYFYVNPLKVSPNSCKHNPELSHVKTVRQPWFGCACCPPNIARTLLSLGSYAYSYSDDAVFVNLYLSSDVMLRLSSCDAYISVDSDYLEHGKVDITASGGVYDIYLRSPADSPAVSISVNGVEQPFDVVNGYVRLHVSDSVKIRMTFDMAPKLVYSHPRVHHTLGKAAVRVGPVIYCAESADNANAPSSRYLPKDCEFTRDKSPKGLPETLPSLTTKACRLTTSDDNLYTTAAPKLEEADLTLIPYHMWGNRGEGEMTVFLHKMV